MTKQTVTYHNYLEFNGRKLAFKAKNLWDITSTPTMINLSDKGWYVNRALLTISKAKELVQVKETTIDIESEQWYLQEQIKLGIKF